MPNLIPRYMCVWPRKSLHLLEERQNHPIVRFAYLCRLISEKSVFLSFLYIKHHELGAEIAVFYGSAVAYYKVELLRFPRQNSSSECTNDAFELLICFCFPYL